MKVYNHVMLGQLEVLKIDKVCLRPKIKPTIERAPIQNMKSIVIVPSDVSGFSRFNLWFNFRVQLKRAEKWS